MPSTFLGLNTGGTGLTYYQAALNTTSHNITNANTKGYTRQQVIASAASALRVNSSYGMQGTGVAVNGVEQLRNTYYDSKYRTNQATYSEYKTENSYLLEVEGYLNEMQSSTGYTEMFGEINSALEELMSNPADSTNRIQFVQSLDNIADLVNEVSNNIRSSQKSANDEVSLYVDKVNSLSKSIYQLNKEIINLETRGGNANDLRDKRALAIDELSSIINVEVSEDPITYGVGENAQESGATRCTVFVNGHVLVDDMSYNEMVAVPRAEKVNQTDISGLYDIYWAGGNGTVGEQFDVYEQTASGTLKGLMNIRDGNNNNPFEGTISNINIGDDSTEATIELASPINVKSLTIPESGIITLNCKQYYYEGFEATSDADGNLNSFTFKNLMMTNEDGSLVQANMDTTLDKGKTGMVGDKVDFKGIPYYMNQLTEFVRTFSEYMNEIHTDPDGADANGDRGLDLFTTPSPDGSNYEVGGSVAAGTFDCNSDSYYKIDPLNWQVNDIIQKDNNKVVVSYKEDIAQGKKEAHGLLDRIVEGFSDKTMFNNGTASQFMQSITSSIAVDAGKTKMFADNQDDICNTIENQRQSYSGVEQNEEASNLVILQSGYNMSCKVISVLNEVYDKLINYTGV